MKFVKIIAIAATASVAATVGAFAKDIKKESQFLETVADKELVGTNAKFTITSDGKISGQQSNGTKFVGAWAWNKRFWCRTLVVGGNQVPQDCQKVTVEGNQVTFIRDKGKGDSGGTYTISN